MADHIYSCSSQWHSCFPFTSVKKMKLIKKLSTFFFIFRVYICIQYDRRYCRVTNSPFHYWEHCVFPTYDVLSLAHVVGVLQELWVATEHTHLLLNHQCLFSISLQVSKGQRQKWVPRIKTKVIHFLHVHVIIWQ